MAEDLVPSPTPFTPPTTEEDRLSCLRLIRSRRVGPATFHRLCAAHGSVDAALDALPGIAQAAGVGGYHPCTRAEAEAEWQAGLRAGAYLILWTETAYPAALRDLPDAPPLLWAVGDCALLHRPAAALVGARNASSLGLRMARRLAIDIGAAGLTVVSGLARGIDTAAHTAALPTGTVAVLAGGIDTVYPAENAALAASIADTGLLLSEAPVGQDPQARHFPARNRIVAALAQAVIVVEAAARSGSLITARAALDLGREVMAVPGHPLDARAAGCNALLRDGAGLVRNGADVLDGLRCAGLLVPRAEPNLRATAVDRAPQTSATGPDGPPRRTVDPGRGPAADPPSGTGSVAPPPFRDAHAAEAEAADTDGTPPLRHAAPGRAPVAQDPAARGTAPRAVTRSAADSARGGTRKAPAAAPRTTTESPVPPQSQTAAAPGPARGDTRPGPVARPPSCVPAAAAAPLSRTDAPSGQPGIAERPVRGTGATAQTHLADAGRSGNSLPPGGDGADGRRAAPDRTDPATAMAMAPGRPGSGDPDAPRARTGDRAHAGGDRMAAVPCGSTGTDRAGPPAIAGPDSADNAAWGVLAEARAASARPAAAQERGVVGTPNPPSTGMTDATGRGTAQAASRAAAISPRGPANAAIRAHTTDDALLGIGAGSQEPGPQDGSRPSAARAGGPPDRSAGGRSTGPERALRIARALSQAPEHVAMAPGSLPRPAGGAPAARRRDATEPAPADPVALLHAAILDRLGAAPIAEDLLIRDLRRPAADVARSLIGLELEGRVTRHPGGLLSRSS